MPVNVSCRVSGASPSAILYLKVTLLSVVVIGSGGFGFTPFDLGAGITVTAPVNPPVRLIVTVIRALVPISPMTVDCSKPIEKSASPGGVTVIRNGHVPCGPATLDAVHVTVVVPTGKVAPEGGTHDTLTPEQFAGSVAAG